MKITTKKVAGGWKATVCYEANVGESEVDDGKRFRTVLGVYWSENEAREAAEAMIELNPASFGHPGESPRVCQPSDIDAVRGKKGKSKC
jgi:ribulose bisphosphate carboxylase small subunit